MARAKKELNVQIVGSVKFDLDAVPRYIAENIGQATLRCVLDFLAQPDGRARIEAKKAELRAQGLL